VPERNAAERRAIEKLIPFQVNGTLEEEDRARVERALEEDAALRDEVVFLEALREGVRASLEVPQAGEFGLARLRRSVRRERRRAFVARTWRPALALAAGLLLIVQTFALLDFSRDAARLAGVASADLQVSFAPDAKEQQIRELLRRVDARIVDGPSAAGLYRLELDPAPTDDAAWARVMAVLEGRPDVVTFLARE